MPQPAIRAPIIAILVFLTSALFARSFLQVELSERGFEANFANDLSYLVVPPLLAALMWPILRSCGTDILDLYLRQKPGTQQILVAIAIGVLARAAYWCTLILCAATGIISATDPAAIVGPVFRFSCPPLQVMLVGMLVWIALVPVVEEVVHRGLVQSSLMHRGRWIAIVGSALIFAAFHSPVSMPLALALGIVFAIQFDKTRSLWPCTLSHATYDGLILLDWRCLRGNWNPPVDTTPIVAPAAWSLIGLVVALATMLWLLKRTGVRHAPRSAAD